jgi:hypothetical protein
MAAVEAAKGAHGEDLLWLEIELGTDSSFVSPMAQLRMLVPHVLDLEQKDVQRLIVGIGGQKPTEFEPTTVLLANASDERIRPAPTRQSVQLDKVGNAVDIQTRAGPVRASPYRLIHGGKVIQVYWLSPTVPLLHLAKIEIPKLEQSLVIHDFGTDATSRVSLPSVNSPNTNVETSSNPEH